MSVMLSMLRRRHGAKLAERDGRAVVAHYGSPAAELAVCEHAVGLAERSDRATLELRGPREEIHRALLELGTLGDAAWWARVSRTRAIVRCETADRGACLAAVRRDAIVTVHELDAEIAALALVGPFAEDLLAAAGLDEDPDAAVVLRDRRAGIELLVPRRLGPALWSRLLDAGEPFAVACVGLEAIEYRAVARELDRRRRVALVGRREAHPAGGPPRNAALTSR
jgi:glycine cleavage system aminomethyltransferase T